MVIGNVVILAGVFTVPPLFRAIRPVRDMLFWWWVLSSLLLPIYVGLEARWMPASEGSAVKTDVKFLVTWLAIFGAAILYSLPFIG